MPNAPVQLYIVDDEPSICVAYARLARSANMQARTFPSVEDFLKAEISDHNACVISDVQFPGLSGLELPARLRDAGRRLPVIFVSAHDNPEVRDIARRAGAVGYFNKPVDDQALLDSIRWALAKYAPSRGSAGN